MAWPSPLFLSSLTAGRKRIGTSHRGESASLPHERTNHEPRATTLPFPIARLRCLGVTRCGGARGAQDTPPQNLLKKRHPVMTLEDYFRHEYLSDPTLPKIDYILRIAPTTGGVQVYLHPANRDGNTTPTLLVRGDSIEWPKT